MKEFEQLKQQIMLLANEENDIDALWLYGSHAKGNAGTDSDVDLAVIFKSYIPDILDRRLRPEVMAIEWIAQLDLADNSLSIVDINNCPVPLAMGILQTGQLLINKSPTHEFNSTRRIMSKWELDYQYHYKTYG